MSENDPKEKEYRYLDEKYCSMFLTSDGSICPNSFQIRLMYSSYVLKLLDIA